MSHAIISHAAENDLAEIVEFIAIDSPNAAGRVLAAFYRTFKLLSEHPNIGREFEHKGQTFRRHPCTGSISAYVVYTRINKLGELEIFRVIHGRRDQASALGEA